VTWVHFPEATTEWRGEDATWMLREVPIASAFVGLGSR
jgi:hypothetical protein